jgi:CelD/BcsL family acetyltransferase involved in cellulose biosynthesis
MKRVSLADTPNLLARAANPNLRVETLQGHTAVVGALTPERLHEWGLLADAAKKVGVFQSPAFVLSWYEAYAEVCEPLLLLGRDPRGHVVGVMPLALAPGGGLVFAGGEDCGYAGWLADPSLEDQFPAACVADLHESGRFRAPWTWPWLAAGSSLAWAHSPVLRSKRIVAQVHAGVTPVVDLQAEPLARFLDPGKRHYRRNVARLQRTGEVRLVETAGRGATDSLFSRFQVLFDIRNLAQHGVAPFTDDPRRARFHRRLIESARASVLFYTLFAGNVPVAFRLDLRDRRRVMARMTAFDHRWAAASPGTLIFDLIAEQLKSEGYEILDYAPGRALYKNEVANVHEAVQALTLWPWAGAARVARARATIRTTTRTALDAVGVSARKRNRLRALVARVRARSLLALGKAVAVRLHRWAWSSDVIIVYQLDVDAWREHHPITDDPRFHRDAVEDLLCGDDSPSDRSRQKLVTEAVERLAAGEHCYTAVVDGRLAHVGWLKLDATDIFVRDAVTSADFGAKWPMPPGSAVTYDVWTAPFARGRGFHQRNVDHTISDALSAGATAVFAAIRSGNAVSRHNAIAAGYREAGRLFTTTRLGRRRRHVVPAAEATLTEADERRPL